MLFFFIINEDLSRYVKQIKTFNQGQFRHNGPDQPETQICVEIDRKQRGPFLGFNYTVKNLDATFTNCLEICLAEK
jgi:hypothetical protein